MTISKKPDFQIGKAYFLCGYYLRDLPIPEIETWIYIGSKFSENVSGNSELFYYFEEPDNYFASEIAKENAKWSEQGITEEPSEAEIPKRLRVAESELEGLVYDYQTLREWVTSLEEEPNAEKAF